MNHLILGAGNLGIDLYHALTKKGHKCLIYTPGCPPRDISNWKSWHYPKDKFFKTQDFEPDVIWNCVGCGSVGGNFEAQFKLCAGLTQKLVMTYKDKMIFTFGSDYALGETHSLYALNKKIQDELVSFHRREGKVNLKCIQVGSLYGKHHPEKTLPWKILNKNKDRLIVELPENMICPTPTDWVSSEIAENLMTLLNARESFFQLAPHGRVSVEQFGRIILENEGVETRRVYKSTGIDSDRPYSTKLSNETLTDKHIPHWSDLYIPYHDFFRGLFKHNEVANARTHQL